MGDRALVLFTDGKDVSPTCYVHWDGDRLPTFLEEHKALMRTRLADIDYAAARFLGICHIHNVGNLGVGCWNTPDNVAAAVPAALTEDATSEADTLAKYTHGNAGVVVVDVRDYKWKAFGGYLAKRSNPALTP